MGLSTLISAIEYLEYMEELQQLGLGRQSTGNAEGSSGVSNVSSNPLQFRRLESTPSESGIINQEEREERHRQQEVAAKEVTLRKEEEDTRFSSSRRRGNGIQSGGMMARRRKMHNILEKSRRAQMRGCLNVLKEILPPPTSHSGTPYGRILTTSTTLVNSVKYIKQLEGEGGKLEGEVKRLQEIRREMEVKLAELKEEAGGDLEMEEEVKDANPPAGLPLAPPSSSSPRSSLDISPVLGVRVPVEEALTISREIPASTFQNAYSTGTAGSSVNPPACVISRSPMPTPVLCDILRQGPLSSPCYPSLGGRASPHGYFYNESSAHHFQRIFSNPLPTPPSPFAPPPLVQFLFVNSFFNMLPFCSLPGGGGGGGCGVGAASSPPPLDHFSQGLSGGGGCYGGGGGGGDDYKNHFFN